MNIPVLLFLSLCIGLITQSCVKDDSIGSSFGSERNLYPFEEGLFFIYEVDSISIESGLNINDTVNFQIKEVHDSLYENSSGDLIMRLRRFKKIPGGDWVISDVWTAEKGRFNIQRVEENLRKISLGFPVTEDNSWDVNAFNIMDEWEASYTGIDEDMSIGDFDFQGSVTVQYEDNINLIEREFASKIYVANVGMVRSHETVLKFNDFIPLDQEPTPDQIELGRIVNYTLIDYGTE